MRIGAGPQGQVGRRGGRWSVRERRMGKGGGEAPSMATTKTAVGGGKTGRGKGSKDEGGKAEEMKQAAATKRTEGKAKVRKKGKPMTRRVGKKITKSERSIDDELAAAKPKDKKEKPKKSKSMESLAPTKTVTLKQKKTGTSKKVKKQRARREKAGMKRDSKESKGSEQEGSEQEDAEQAERQAAELREKKTRLDTANREGLGKASWYVGAMPREWVEEQLSGLDAGAFGVRLTMAKIQGQEDEEADSVKYIVSVKQTSGSVKHVALSRGEETRWEWSSDGGSTRFRSVPELVQHYGGRGTLALGGGKETKLGKPICRPAWLLRDVDILCGQEIGKGAFGQVCRGTLCGETVVIKKTKARMTDDERKEMIREAMLLLMNKHWNIVVCQGIAADSLPIAIVMELCEKGSLDRYLRKEERAPALKLQWCYEAAWGLAFLEIRQPRIVHRDVAARNCLICSDDRLKISDMGMSKKTDKYGEYRSKDRRNIPFRWAAPEVLRDNLYSNKSDVFAFAVLSWEIWADGAKPWGEKSSKAIVESVLEGRRLDFLPDFGTPATLVELLTRCMAHNRDDRPDFAAICPRINTIRHADAAAAEQPPSKKEKSKSLSSHAPTAPDAVTVVPESVVPSAAPPPSEAQDHPLPPDP